MADFLKTYVENEPIYASDRNSDNQYLLTKISDNAAQVQNYVEGEVIAIKSNIASVQTTLQADIDVLKNGVGKSISYIVETFVEGTSGYLLFSDGCKIQWGKTAKGGNGSVMTITLLKEFSDSNYIIAGSATYNQTAGDKGSSWRAYDQQPTQFKIGTEFSQQTANVSWIAIGY